MKEAARAVSFSFTNDGIVLLYHFQSKAWQVLYRRCREDLPGRILHHNAHLYGNHRFTAAASDWELFLAIPVKDYSHAIRLERLIKAMKSAKYIRNLKKYPALVEKIVNETSKDSPEGTLSRYLIM
ncbi:MAG TPA: hypothetical protein PK939_01950 [Bacteroidales bacterium]|nr:hypothetical protein [Bacteroidales bacterium]